MRRMRHAVVSRFWFAMPLLTLAAAPLQAQSVITVIVDRSTPDGRSNFSIGVTHTQPKWEDGDPIAVARAKSLLAGGLEFQNQHLMDWGTENPEPKPGVYNWASLDKRVALMRSMRATVVITLCTAPGWMKTSGEDFPRQTGPDSWADDRVADNHVDDFVELARKVVLRYPDVKYFQIWNEYKGYWDKGADNWDFVRFTDFYNRVYDAIKSARPDAQLGGPYYPFDGPKPRDWEVIDYWMQHKHGADFVCFDGWVAGYPPTRARDEEAKKMARTDYFGKIADRLRTMSTLPIWISEFYGGWSSDPQFTAANHASCYLHALRCGVAVALLWDAELQRWNYLFTSTKGPEGGQPSPHYRVVKIFNTEFGPDTELFKARSSSPDVEVLASRTKTLLINKRDVKLAVRLDGVPITLDPYEVRLLEAGAP